MAQHEDSVTSHKRRPKKRKSETSKTDESEALANIIKGVHKNLKKEFLKTGDQDTVWNSHLQRTETLKSYANAMRDLATKHWRTGQGNRIEWVHRICQDYFQNGGMQKWLDKDSRRRSFHQEPEPEVSEEEKVKVDVKLELLDVGSCYDPFSVYDDYHVTALDLCPVNSNVYQCDILSVSIDRKLEIRDGRIEELPQSGFDIIVFCLLLEYLPSPAQRFECIRRSWTLLRFYGLLVIVTPDSHKQHRGAERMKEWKSAIESVGFHRIKYEKLEHLHGLAFRKISRTDEPSVDMAKNLYVPQDFNTEISDDDDDDDDNDIRNEEIPVKLPKTGENSASAE